MDSSELVKPLWSVPARCTQVQYIYDIAGIVHDASTGVIASEIESTNAGIANMHLNRGVQQEGRSTVRLLY